MSFLWGSTWSPKGKHCYVTGGSSGLGLALSILLAQRGAHVSIVARDQDKLDTALQAIEAERVSPDQIFQAASHSLNTGEGARAALKDICTRHGGLSPDAVFMCAGSWAPRFWVESTEEQLRQGMDGGYWVQAWTAWAASQQMVRQERKGKLVFVSSTLGYMTFVGWSGYAPAKHALRGLADTLRSELLLYDIDVHLFSPPTMYTPGYDEENKLKPAITLKIEEGDPGLTPGQAALGLLRGVEKGQAHIAADLITNLFRASTKGSAPGNNPLIDWALNTFAQVGVPIWRWGTEAKVKAHKEEHKKYLKDRGFFDGPPL
ncbi:oxidoreductase [Panus rudis PR-1116 ss-1]|nr:oxidoreductase [Panus rudis PR-1116 ss-1]